MNMRFLVAGVIFCSSQALAEQPPQRPSPEAITIDLLEQEGRNLRRTIGQLGAEVNRLTDALAFAQKERGEKKCDTPPVEKQQ